MRVERILTRIPNWRWYFVVHGLIDKCRFLLPTAGMCFVIGWPTPAGLHSGQDQRGKIDANTVKLRKAARLIHHLRRCQDQSLGGSPTAWWKPNLLLFSLLFSSVIFENQLILNVSAGVTLVNEPHG